MKNAQAVVAAAAVAVAASVAVVVATSAVAAVATSVAVADAIATASARAVASSATTATGDPQFVTHHQVRRETLKNKSAHASGVRAFFLRTSCVQFLTNGEIASARLGWGSLRRKNASAKFDRTTQEAIHQGAIERAQAMIAQPKIAQPTTTQPTV